MRAEIMWFISTLYPQYLDNPCHMCPIQFTEKKERQEGEERDI